MDPLVEPVKAAYGAGSLDQVVPALLHGRSPDWLPEPVTDADSIVLLLLDGLGWNQLEAHRAIAPQLSAMTGGRITTVSPSTTASALTSSLQR